MFFLFLLISTLHRIWEKSAEQALPGSQGGRGERVEEGGRGKK
jgi:hypothetical protein